MTHRAAHPRAFTLLELTVAIAMTAALGLSLYVALSIAFRARDSVRSQTTAIREASIALDVIAQELNSVIPPADTPMAGPFLGYTNGSVDLPADSVEFYTFGRDADFAATGDGYDFAPTSDGVRWVQLGLRTDTDPPVLVRNVERNVLATTLAEPTEEILLTNVLGLGLRYFDGTSWVEEWDSTTYGNSLPLAVEITLVLDQPIDDEATTSLVGPQGQAVTQIIPLAAANPTAIATAQGLTTE